MTGAQLETARELRQRIQSGDPTYGGWIYINNSFSAEIVARSGFDWCCIDTQHGLARSGDLVPLLQAVEVVGKTVLVRVPWNEPGVIMNALDAGASGVIVPMVNTAAEARRAVEACRYPPAGDRSWGPTRASLGAPEYSPSWANERVMCIVMVETLAGVQNIDAILSVPGIDAIFIGPTDLALSLNAGRSDAITIEQIDASHAACSDRGTPTAIAATTSDEAKRWASTGFAMIALPSDSVLLTQACTALLASVREN